MEIYPMDSAIQRLNNQRLVCNDLVSIGSVWSFSQPVKTNTERENVDTSEGLRCQEDQTA